MIQIPVGLQKYLNHYTHSPAPTKSLTTTFIKPSTLIHQAARQEIYSWWHSENTIN